MLEVREIYKTFNAGTINEKRAMNGVTLTLNEGDFATVIGGNGAGKSTLLNLVAGVYPVDSGSIAIGGQNVTRLPEHKRARFIGRVFQDPMMGTAATMQIEENLALAARRGQSRSRPRPAPSPAPARRGTSSRPPCPSSSISRRTWAHPSITLRSMRSWRTCAARSISISACPSPASTSGPTPACRNFPTS